MRIAQISPLWESVPPTTYGGVELVVSLLSDELVRRGHEVTLFASGDSQTLGRLEAICPQSLRCLKIDVSPEHINSIYQTLQLNKVVEQSGKFDIIHSHVGMATFPFANLLKTPIVHTVHGPVLPIEEALWRYVNKQNFISISNAQRRNDLGLNYVATVYNGINPQKYPLYSQPASPPYLAFLGRFSPEKGPHLAIEIAKRVGLPLKMAGKVDVVDRLYYENEVKPHIDGKQIEFLGEANHTTKCELMGRALATLFPITWQEPFGLVMIESMALGTPVIAMKMGSTPEVIADSETGFLCQNVEDCIAAVKNIDKISRIACRDRVVENFSVRRMVDEYETAYRQLLLEKVTNDGAGVHLHQLKGLNLLSA